MGCLFSFFHVKSTIHGPVNLRQDKASEDPVQHKRDYEGEGYVLKCVYMQSFKFLKIR